MSAQNHGRRRMFNATLLATFMATLAACGAPAATQTAPSEAPVAEASAAAPSIAAASSAAVASVAAASQAPVDQAAAGYIAPPIDGVPAAYTKFPASFNKTVSNPPGTGKPFRTLQYVYQPPVPPHDENLYWQELEKRLNATVEADLTPSDTFAEKFTAVLSGGELPELITLEPTAYPDQYKYLQQGAFTDLTPYLTGDALKEYPNLAAFPEYLWKNVAFQGKIYGVPRDVGLNGTALYFRKDWAEKVGMPEPKTAEDFFNLLVAFTNDDPDGNGTPDTYGLGGPRYARDWLQFLFRVPNGWRVNDDGSLTAAIETPEFKQMVEFQRRLYEAGVYYPDTTINWKEGFFAGKYGAYPDGPGGLPGSTGARARTKAVTPSADVVGLLPFGHDGGEAVTHNSRGFWGFAAMSVEAGKDPERVKELLRILDFYAAPYGSEEWLFLKYGVEGEHHTVNADGTRTLTERGKKEIGDLTYLALPPTIYSYDVPGDAEYMQQLAADYLEIGIDNPTTTLFSETNVSRGGELGQFVDDKLADIITGRAPLDSLDGVIAEWRTRGGDQMRQEYQESLTSQ